MDRAASDLSWLGGEEQQVAGETEEADLCNCVSSLCGYVPIPFEVGDDGTDKVLVVYEQVEDIDSTGVTYNGLSLTLAEAATGGDKEAKIWYLLDPPLGVANVVISYSAADTVLKTGGVLVLKRVDQANPLGGADKLVDQASSATPSIGLTTTEDRSWVIDSAKSGAAAGALSADPSQTQFAPRSLTGQVFDTAGASLEPTATAGSVTMSWTSASADVWSIAAAEFLLATGDAVVKETGVPLETVAGLAPERLTLLETLTSLTRERGLPDETLSGLSRARLPPLESLLGLTNDRAVP